MSLIIVFIPKSFPLLLAITAERQVVTVRASLRFAQLQQVLKLTLAVASAR